MTAAVFRDVILGTLIFSVPIKNKMNLLSECVNTVFNNYDYLFNIKNGVIFNCIIVFKNYFKFKKHSRVA